MPTMHFSGEYEAKLDAKGRLLLPARLKARLPEGEQELVVLRGFEPCLVVYPAAAWRTIYDQVAGLNEFSAEARTFQRSFLRGATEVELDAAGRLLLPKSMLAHASLEQAVLAVGVANRIELWEPTQYQNHLTADQAALSAAAEKFWAKHVSLSLSYTATDWFMDGDALGQGYKQPYHKPVMLRECIAELAIKPEGTYVDCTFGGGGHSEMMVQMVPQGRLIGFDQDPDAYQNAATWQRDNFTFVRANFRHLERYLDSMGATPVDGILADLGISSFQIDEPSKGFSIRFDGPLDMRMNNSGGISAEEVINEYPAEKLARIFKEYGEVMNPRRLSEHIIAERARRPISTTAQLKEAVLKLAPRKLEHKFLAQVFQAIRIEVNDELEALKEMLEQAARVLRPGGRLIVLTYHSLEDRLVKNFITEGRFDGEADRDVYGNTLGKLLEPVWRKALVPTADEVSANPRARSAKLRVAERVEPKVGKVAPRR